MNWLRVFATFLIFIVIIGLGVVTYQLIFQDKPKKIVEDNKETTKEIVTTYSADLKPSLMEIEQSRQNGVKPYQIEARTQKILKETQEQKEKITKALTLGDLKKKLNEDKTKATSINQLKPKKNIYDTQQKETFDILKTLLFKASANHLSTQNIVLNSSISSILKSQKEREKFLQLVSQKFQLPIEVVEELSYNNGYLWDWIQALNNR